MRRVGWIGAFLLCLLGCHTPQKSLKPDIPEEYNLPPADDPRFSTPIRYPKETLNNFQFKRDPLMQPGGPGGGGPGGSSGPRGPGGGMNSSSVRGY